MNTKNIVYPNIELLIHAAASTYGKKERETQINKALNESGYHFAHVVDPKTSASGSLAVNCIAPLNNHAPIIIAFRGTKTSKDIYSDARIGSTGVVEKKFRDDCFNFYKEIKKNNPDREIILTGHSLGGNLAQYVAIRANNEAHNNNEPLPNIIVRTFNSAPIKTHHANVFTSHPELLRNIVNYRLSTDVVSSTKIPFQSSYGNIFIFKSNKINSHGIDNMLSDLPEDIRTQPIGGNSQQNRIQEQIRGAFKSYQTRLAGLWFVWTGMRAESRNNQLFINSENAILEDIAKNQYQAASAKLLALKNAVRGSYPNGLIDKLLESMKPLLDAENNKKNTDFNTVMSPAHDTARTPHQFSLPLNPPRDTSASNPIESAERRDTHPIIVRNC